MSNPSRPAAESTARLSLPFLLAGQGSKHITHNEALARVDRLAHLCVQGESDAEPDGAEDGLSWIVGGGWELAGAAPGDIATRVGDPAGGRWEVQSPARGFLAWVSDRAALVAWDGAAWVAAGAPDAPETVERLGVGTEADDLNRLAVKSDAVLVSARDGGSGDVRVGLNRHGSADTASVVFSTDYAGGAELGLAGDGDFRLKVSADGEAFRTGLCVGAATGFVGVGAGAGGGAGGGGGSPAYHLHVDDRDEDGHVRVTVDNRATGASAGSAMLLRTGTGANMTFLQLASGTAYLIASGDSFVQHLTGANAEYRFFCGSREALQMTSRRVSALQPLRLKHTGLAALPAPGMAGSGAVVWVSDGAKGPGLAVSTGSAWRWVHDRSPVV